MPADDDDNGAGSGAGFNAVFAEHVDAIYGFLARRVGPETAETLTAATYLEALARKDRYDSDRAPIRPWLFGIAIDVMRRFHAHEERALRAIAANAGLAYLTDEVDVDRVDSTIDSEARWPEIATELLIMGQDEREVLLLRAWTGMASSTVARMLDVPVDTIRLRFSRARQHLSAALIQPRPDRDERRRPPSDDYLFALLHGFRSDEARIDDAIRARIWAEILDEDPEASIWLDTIDRWARVRQIRRAAPRPSRILVVAAVLTLLAAVQVVARSGPSREPYVSAGPSTTVPMPRDLDELADRVTLVTGAVLGESDGTRYTFQRGDRAARDIETGPVQTRSQQRWVAIDGSGREVIDVEGRAPDVHTREPGFLQIGFLPPDLVRGLPDDAARVLDTYERNNGVVAPQVSIQLIDLLVYAGVPGPARAGALRALDQLGFEPGPGPDPAPNLWRVEGPGPDGLRVQVDFDLTTYEVDAWTRLEPDGGFIRLTSIETGLRRDTQGS